MFVSYEDYIVHGNATLSEDATYKYLKIAERQINTICLNRISNGEINSYHPNTIELVKTIICEHAEYLYENKDQINNGIIKSYSNNGASVSYEIGGAVKYVSGVLIRGDIYDELVLTGLCYCGIL